MVTAAKYLQSVTQHYQSISLYKSPVQGSIHQVGHDQYYVGRDQYNFDASRLVGPRTRRTAKHITSVLLIIGGLLVSIPSAGMLPFFDSIVNGMTQPLTQEQSMPGAAGFIATANSFGTAAHLMIYTMIGLGIIMVIAGVWLRWNLRKS